MKNNTSTQFILPLLYDGKYDSRYFNNEYFIGAYITDVDRHSYEYEILLVFNAKNSVNYHKYIVDIMKNEYYSGIHYSYYPEAIEILVFKLPIKYEEDYDLILEGNYNSISPEAKLKLAKFWGNSDEWYNIYLKTFNREIIKSELSDIEEEFFDVKTI